ncbi:hypothetical protein [Pseudogemmobacter blasticus]|uniref:Uncharacterized protein n=1 Tax=Fuscovulum blasticum DSM 2131 TaxID=1188250 RepID=A0A2T4JEV2_FUSBL|nr:hypothetical protein [Fuscovulum blasticum]PTE16327.1 hypothetical protein C5F44_00200 [Fuscovulum blasticum DSM 2131]
MKTTLALALIAGAALPAKAENLFQRPAGCVLVATVQDDHCAALNYFRCAGTDPVVFRMEASYGGGKGEVHTFDANHGGIEILTPPGGGEFRLRATGDHPRVAVERGTARKTEQATISRDGKSQQATMVMVYTYSGETRKLAGEVFHRLTYDSTLTFPQSGSELHTSGSVLFNDRLDLLVNELEVSDGQGGAGRQIKLKSLALDGQKGFGATKPRFGCHASGELAVPRREDHA